MGGAGRGLAGRGECEGREKRGGYVEFLPGAPRAVSLFSARPPAARRQGSTGHDPLPYPPSSLSSYSQLNILLTLEAKFDLTFDDEAAAARASSPGACADLLAGGVARADARAAAGPLAGADDVEALVAASSFFQFSSEMAASRGEPLGPTVKIKTGRGWEMEGDELEGG
jgi:hypothetical protein